MGGVVSHAHFSENNLAEFITQSWECTYLLDSVAPPKTMHLREVKCSTTQNRRPSPAAGRAEAWKKARAESESSPRSSDGMDASTRLWDAAQWKMPVTESEKHLTLKNIQVCCLNKKNQRAQKGNIKLGGNWRGDRELLQQFFFRNRRIFILQMIESF